MKGRVAPSRGVLASDRTSAPTLIVAIGAPSASLPRWPLGSSPHSVLVTRCDVCRRASLDLRVLSHIPYISKIVPSVRSYAYPSRRCSAIASARGQLHAYTVYPGVETL